MKHAVILTLAFLLLLTMGIYDIKNKYTPIEYNSLYTKEYIVGNNTQNTQKVIISAIGDCVIGTDTNYVYSTSFNAKMKEVNDYSYFFSGVYSVLGHDDLTIANLESVLTDANVKKTKLYNYKGPKDFVNILTKGSIESVNVANNHTFDYLQKGYDDTLNTLNKAEIEYFGYNKYSIVEVNGIKIGLIGLPGWDYGTAKKAIDKAIKYMDSVGVNLKIFSFHWGGQKVYNYNSTQEKVGKYAVDKGADLVIGHHPHVIQGIEKYKDKYIIYCIGNFVYGGIYYPYDTDTMIIQMTYYFKDKKLENYNFEIIPASITSSSKGINNYRPKILEGSEKVRVLKKILRYSVNLDYKY